MQFDDPELVTLDEAADMVPGGVHPATVWRWINNGHFGVHLDSVKIGRKTYTTYAALRTFCDEVTVAKRRFYSGTSS